MKINTLEMVKMMVSDSQLKFKTMVDEKEILVFTNQKGGISTGKDNLRMTEKVMNAEWELVLDRYSFMDAINSKKRIKHESWSHFRSINEALYDLLDSKESNVILMINGNWNIES